MIVLESIYHIISVFYPFSSSSSSLCSESSVNEAGAQWVCKGSSQGPTRMCVLCYAAHIPVHKDLFHCHSHGAGRGGGKWGREGLEKGKEVHWENRMICSVRVCTTVTWFTSPCCHSLQGGRSVSHSFSFFPLSVSAWQFFRSQCKKGVHRKKFSSGLLALRRLLCMEKWPHLTSSFQMSC